VNTLVDDGPLVSGAGADASSAFPFGLSTGVEFERAGRVGAIRVASACTSFALHVVIFALAALWVSHRSGLVEEESAAVTVELLYTGGVEQLPAEEISEVAQDAARAVTAAEAPETTELKEVAEEATAVPGVAPATDGMDVIKGSEAAEEAVGTSAEAKPDPDKSVGRQRQADAPKPTREPPKPERPKTAKPERESPAESTSVGAKAKAPRASASTGSVLNYASRVRAKVSGHVPRSGAGKGSVVVSFGVSSSGGLSYARIAKSSGNAAIDRSVLAGVRASSPFPPPPAGASPAQLRFSVSFHFK
jgi:protein TonB